MNQMEIHWNTIGDEMLKIILQPCANKVSREHYEVTIRKTDKLDTVRQILNNKNFSVGKHLS